MASDSAAACLHDISSDANRPITPPHLKPFRKTSRQDPGTRFVHRGVLDMAAITSQDRFGVTTDKGSSAHDALHVEPTSPLQAYVQQTKEYVYRSHSSKPLGRTRTTASREHPSFTRNPEFRFGTHTIESESSMSVMYTGALAEDARKPVTDDQVTNPHKKPMDWSGTKVDPTNCRFGYSPDLQSRLTVSDSIKQVQPKATLVSTAVQKHSIRNPPAKTTDMSKYDVVHGVSQKKTDDWDAAHCIFSNCTKEMQMPDKTFGRSHKVIKDSVADYSQSYGVKSADIVNDGVVLQTEDDRDPTVVTNDILFPNSYGSVSVPKHEFNRVRPVDEIRELLENAAINSTDEQWNQVLSFMFQRGLPMNLESAKRAYNTVVRGLKWVEN